MKLGARILLALALLLALLVASLVLPLTRFVLGEFDRIEQKMAFSRAEDIHLALESLQRFQVATVVDWANWDAMVRFVQDQNPEFQQENLGVKTLDDLAIEALLVFDPSGKMVWGQAIAPDEVRFTPPDEYLLALGLGDHPLLTFDEEHPVRTGLIPVEAGSLRLAVAAPIRTSQREGPVRGTVVMVTRLGPDELANLVAGLEPTFVDAARWPAFPSAARVDVQVVDGQELRAHAFLRDMEGRPLSVLEVRLPRDIHRQGVRTIFLFGIVLLCALGLFSGLYFLALRRMVVARVERLGREVLRIAEGQRAGDAVAISGRDELARLAQDINRLLAHREAVSRTLVESRQQYEELFRRMRNGFAHHEIICDAQGRPVDYRFLSVNPAFEQLTGLKAEAVVGRTVREILPETEDYWIQTYGRVALAGEAIQFDYGSAALGKHFEVSAFRPAPGQFACIFSEVTERKRDESRIKELLDEAVQARSALLGLLEDQQRAEREREAMRVQVQQSQKMESVGRLAGGVAHDFNNMLQIILGNLELLQLQVGPEKGVQASIQEIRKAAQHSADLTRQLLAYARKQMVLPRVLDLNQKVAGMLNMLRRLLGEEIDLQWTPSPVPAMVKMDPTQLDQILINLILNARDALQGGGQVILETHAASFLARDNDRPPELAPGSYVGLKVTDTGCGMPEAVLRNIFEPFFTTKPLGKGTGLGLPTVYGIVKQNHGDVVVHSAVGKGSTFHIYLPLHRSGPEAAATEAPAGPVAGGRESVLVAEDEEGVRRMLKLTLESLGYSVHAFACPVAALEAARSPDARFDLLISDVVMPGLSGCDLMREVRGLHPALKGLFISGYPDEYIARCGMLDEAMAFLPKPFTREQLAEKTRAVLGG